MSPSSSVSGFDPRTVFPSRPLSLVELALKHTPPEGYADLLLNGDVPEQAQKLFSPSMTVCLDKPKDGVPTTAFCRQLSNIASAIRREAKLEQALQSIVAAQSESRGEPLEPANSDTLRTASIELTRLQGRQIGRRVALSCVTEPALLAASLVIVGSDFANTIAPLVRPVTVRACAIALLACSETQDFVKAWREHPAFSASAEAAYAALGDHRDLLLMHLKQAIQAADQANQMLVHMIRNLGA